MKKQIGKRILVFLCIIAMLFSYCACGKKAEDDTKNDPVVNPVTDPAKEQTSDDKKQDNAPDAGNKDSADSKNDDSNVEAKSGDSNTSGSDVANAEGSGIDSIIEENNKLDYAFSYDGKNYGFRNDLKTYLIMGVDRYGEVQKSDKYIGTGQCDAIYLLVLDSAGSKYSVLQLNRDAMVEMNILGVFGDVVGTEVQQLALSHAYGDGEALSCKNTLNAVSKWLNGVPINGYAALQFDALPILNDDIGGVDVYIEDDWTNIDKTLKKGTTVHLLGDHALNYVHARQKVSDGYNESRMRRHRTYLDAFSAQFKLKFKEGSDIVNIMYNDVKPYMCTDLSVGTISNIAAKAIEYDFSGIQTIKGSNKIVTYNSGVTLMEFWADEASLNETVINLFCKEVR